MASIRKTLNRANIIALCVFIPLCLVLVSVYVYEKTQTVSDYIKYYYVLPTKYNFIEGDVIQYYSLSEGVREAPYIQWREVTRCNSGNGFGYHDQDSSDAYDYFLDRTISPTIRVLSETLTDHNFDFSDDIGHVDRDIESQLREYAKLRTDLGPWTLNITPPKNGSVCLTRHTVSVTTPILGLTLTDSFTSAPFTYGVKQLEELEAGQDDQ